MLNTVLKVLSGLGIVVSAFLAIYDLWHMQFAWGLLMIFCFFLNLKTYRDCCRD